MGEERDREKKDSKVGRVVVVGVVVVVGAVVVRRS